MHEEARIEFSLTEQTPIAVEIRNADGKLVRMILQETMVDPGRFTLVWDGKNEQSQPVSAGAYVFVVRSKERVVSHGVITKHR